MRQNTESFIKIAMCKTKIILHLQRFTEHSYLCISIAISESVLMFCSRIFVLTVILLLLLWRAETFESNPNTYSKLNENGVKVFQSELNNLYWGPSSPVYVS